MIDAEDDAMHGILPGTTDAVDPSSAWNIAGDAGVALGTGTGQHGITPQPSGGGMGNAFVRIWEWLNRPFKTPLSPVDITLLIGVVMVAILAWNLILYHIRIAAEAV